jgi:hypothetical protein
MVIISPCSRLITKTLGLCLLLGLRSPPTWLFALGRMDINALHPRDRVQIVGPKVFSPSSWYCAVLVGIV